MSAQSPPKHCFICLNAVPSNSSSSTADGINYSTEVTQQLFAAFLACFSPSATGNSNDLLNAFPEIENTIKICTLCRKWLEELYQVSSQVSALMSRLTHLKACLTCVILERRVTIRPEKINDKVNQLIESINKTLRKELSPRVQVERLNRKAIGPGKHKIKRRIQTVGDSETAIPNNSADLQRSHKQVSYVSQRRLPPGIEEIELNKFTYKEKYTFREEEEDKFVCDGCDYVRFTLGGMAKHMDYFHVGTEWTLSQSTKKLYEAPPSSESKAVEQSLFLATVEQCPSPVTFERSPSPASFEQCPSPISVELNENPVEAMVTNSESLEPKEDEPAVATTSESVRAKQTSVTMETNLESDNESLKSVEDNDEDLEWDEDNEDLASVAADIPTEPSSETTNEPHKEKPKRRPRGSGVKRKEKTADGTEKKKPKVMCKAQEIVPGVEFEYCGYRYRLAETENRFFCLHCTRSSIKQQGIHTHIRQDHFERPDRYVCDQCGAEKKTHSALRKHQIRHRQEKVGCPLCSKLMGRDHLRVHLKIHEEGDAARKWICETCGKKFLLQNQLLRHLASHTGLTHLYSCDHCGGGFKYLVDLKEHLRLEHLEALGLVGSSVGSNEELQNAVDSLNSKNVQ